MNASCSCHHNFRLILCSHILEAGRWRVRSPPLARLSRTMCRGRLNCPSPRAAQWHLHCCEIGRNAWRWSFWCTTKCRWGRQARYFPTRARLAVGVACRQLHFAPSCCNAEETWNCRLILLSWASPRAIFHKFAQSCGRLCHGVGRWGHASALGPSIRVQLPFWECLQGCS